MLYAHFGPAMPGILAASGRELAEHRQPPLSDEPGHLRRRPRASSRRTCSITCCSACSRRGSASGRLFIDLASCVAGRYAGGPAKVSIFGSALFGMISGSSIANTVTVGSLTIPAMIRLGYQRHFAAAVESTASTGGQITPPIMGAAAFLMVEFLNRLLPDGDPRRDRAGLHAFLRRVHAGPFRGQALAAARPDGRGAARSRPGRPRGLADDHAACGPAHRAVLRLHALPRGVLGHHRRASWSGSSGSRP